MIVGSHQFESYLKCPTKCWLQSRAEPPAENPYAEWASAQRGTYFRAGLKRLVDTFPASACAIAPPFPKDPKEVVWRLAIDVRWKTRDLETCLQAVERVPVKGRGRPPTFIPYRFEPLNKITREHRLLLAFETLRLSESVGREVRLGKIVHGDNYATLNVQTLPFAKEVRKLMNDITALLTGNTPPDLVLNRHCHQCEFQSRCRTQASEKDELSLLSGMSERDRKKLHAKGIFTVTQLSHTFRPRRRRRESRGKQEKHHHSLRALAIRENKIHAVGIPALKLEGTRVFMDVEGIPDRDDYYLIGLRVEAAEGEVQHSLWADKAKGEKLIWSDFLGILSGITNPQLIHYGSYETIFLRQMCQRHGRPPEGSQAATAVDHTINVLSFIYARVYFPTYSNGLKEITGYLGFPWSGSPSSGLESIAWRHRWEMSMEPALKQALLDYNRQDCEAIAFLTRKLADLHALAPSDSKPLQGAAVLTSNIKRESPYGLFKRVQFALPELEAINNAAYWDYQRERIYAKSNNNPSRKPRRRVAIRSVLMPNTTAEYPRPSSCPKCNSVLLHKQILTSRNVIDLRFTRHGIKRWITRHLAHRYECQSCKSTFLPLDRCSSKSKYGPNIIAYSVYLNIELRLPQERVNSHLSKLFGLSFPSASKFKMQAAEAYRSVYDSILKGLCSGRLLHVDETSISVKGRNGYVWVLTSMEEVAYFYTPTREGSTIQTMLKDFSGVLVSDFYTAYDAIDCAQQKCLVHFIRDLNDDLLKHPYDDVLKRLGREFVYLVKPMIETVDQYGLKRRFLNKHRISVDRFYRHLSDETGAGEAATKVIERLRRNRDTMFTFLNFDDVPWNNNNAEHAIKAFATLRRVIDGVTSEKGLQDFLILLSLCETCKYKSVDFLGFLRSGSKNVDDFANSRRSGA
jgi:predicted RecB family nuclease